MASTSAQLSRLPSELRVQIFGYLLRYNGVLRRRSTVTTEWLKNGQSGDTTAAHDHVTLQPVDSNLFLICRTLTEEALDVFYDSNRFKIHFNHLCTCQGRFRFAAFDEARIRRLDVYDFNPRSNLMTVCRMCHGAGLGLLSYLDQLPRLQSVNVAFEDFMSIDDFVSSALAEPKVRLEALEVGRFHVASARIRTELRLPLLNQAWCNLADMSNGNRIKLPRPPGEESVRHALEYLQFEANDWGRVPTSLYEFFDVERTETPSLLRLRLSGRSDSGKRILRFTSALAEVLGDLFVEDCTTDSLEWEYVGRPETLRWDFRMGVNLEGRSNRRLVSLQ